MVVVVVVGFVMQRHVVHVKYYLLCISVSMCVIIILIIINNITQCRVALYNNN